MIVRMGHRAHRHGQLLCAEMLSLLACSATDALGPTRDNSPVQTDATVYYLRRATNAWTATAKATYVNRGTTPVFYARCGVGDYAGPLFGLRRTGPDSTRTFWSDIAWACVGGVPTGEIRAGDSLTIEVRLGAYDQPTMSPPLRPEDFTGLLRVVLQLCGAVSADSDRCQALPHGLRESNAFVVRF